MFPGVELRLFRYVVAIAEELHFRRAAERLHVAQPCLSKQIRDLEDELGVKLFHRTKRHVELTEAGRRFVSEARLVLQHTERAVSLAKSITADSSLQIGYSPHINARIVSHARSLASTHLTDSKLDFHSMFSMAQAEAVLHGKLDAGLVLMPVRDESLSVSVLDREPLIAVVSSSHRLAARKSIHLQELTGDPVILLSRSLHSPLYSSIVSTWQKAGYSVNLVQDVNNIAEGLALVAENVGITFTKRSAQRLRQEGVVFLDLKDKHCGCVETAVIHRKDNQSELLQKFLGLLLGTTASAKGWPTKRRPAAAVAEGSERLFA